MPRRIPNEFFSIPRAHRYAAARAVENVEDWHRQAGRCIAVTVEPGKRGKFPGVRRVWVNSTEGDRARRGLRVPDYMTPGEYRALVHKYLAYLLTRRVGLAGHILKPL